MKMFLGEYQPNITDGSRISLPKKLREQIEGDEVILSKGFERCIFVYDKEDWLLEAQKQVENPITDYICTILLESIEKIYVFGRL